MERGQLASGVWGKGSWDAVWRWGSCPAASAIKWGSPSCCSPPDWQELSLSNELPPNRGTSFLWLGMRTIPHPLCGSHAWCLHVGDIQAQHIPCVSTTPPSLVPGEGSTGGDHGVSRDPEPKVCWHELIPQLRAPSPYPVQIWCVTQTEGHTP